MKKDLAIVGVVAALAVAAFLLSSDTTPAAPGGGPNGGARNPYRPDGAETLLVKYRAEGGLGSIALFEVEIRGPGECPVRWQARRGPLSERSHQLPDAGFRDLMERLARADFFQVESVPRSGYHSDMATVTIALTVGDRHNEVVIDGRRRPSRDLAALLEYFDALRRSATPESVATGD